MTKCNYIFIKISYSILFLLNSDGVILSLDLTKYTDKWRKNWLTLFMHEFNHTAIIIMLTNIFTIVFYIVYVRNRRRQVQTRNTEINQALQEFIRLNNIQTTIGNNLVNGLFNHATQNNLDNNRNIENSNNNFGQEQSVNNQNVEVVQPIGDDHNTIIQQQIQNVLNVEDEPQIAEENIQINNINNSDNNLINEDNQ
jgi:hypothetical protein